MESSDVSHSCPSCPPFSVLQERRGGGGKGGGGNKGVINESLSLQGRSEDAVFREKLLLALEHMRNKVRLVGAAEICDSLFIQETKNHVLYYAGATGGSGLGFKISPEQTDTRRNS